jgi:hypothetical protein
MGKTSEIAGLSLLFAGLSFLLWQTFSFDPVDLGAGIGPAFWARSVIGLALLLIAVQFYRALRGASSAPSGSAATPKVREPASRVFTRLAIIFGYLVAVPVIGFFWASPLFLFIALSYFGRHGHLKNLSISLGVTCALLIIYIAVLYVPLPKGMWIFEDASNLLLRIFMH